MQTSGLPGQPGQVPFNPTQPPLVPQSPVGQGTPPLPGAMLASYDPRKGKLPVPNPHTYPPTAVPPPRPRGSVSTPPTNLANDYATDNGVQLDDERFGQQNPGRLNGNVIDYGPQSQPVSPWAKYAKGAPADPSWLKPGPNTLRYNKATGQYEGHFDTMERRKPIPLAHSQESVWHAIKHGTLGGMRDLAGAALNSILDGGDPTNKQQANDIARFFTDGTQSPWLRSRLGPVGEWLATHGGAPTGRNDVNDVLGAYAAPGLNAKTVYDLITNPSSVPLTTLTTDPKHPGEFAMPTSLWDQIPKPAKEVASMVVNPSTKPGAPTPQSIADETINYISNHPWATTATTAAVVGGLAHGAMGIVDGISERASAPRGVNPENIGAVSSEHNLISVRDQLNNAAKRSYANGHYADGNMYTAKAKAIETYITEGVKNGKLQDIGNGEYRPVTPSEETPKAGLTEPRPPTQSTPFDDEKSRIKSAYEEHLEDKLREAEQARNLRTQKNPNDVADVDRMNSRDVYDERMRKEQTEKDLRTAISDFNTKADKLENGDTNGLYKLYMDSTHSRFDNLEPMSVYVEKANFGGTLGDVITAATNHLLEFVKDPKAERAVFQAGINAVKNSSAAIKNAYDYGSGYNQLNGSAAGFKPGDEISRMGRGPMAATEEIRARFEYGCQLYKVAEAEARAKNLSGAEAEKFINQAIQSPSREIAGKANDATRSALSGGPNDWLSNFLNEKLKWVAPGPMKNVLTAAAGPAKSAGKTVAREVETAASVLPSDKFKAVLKKTRPGADVGNAGELQTEMQHKFVKNLVRRGLLTGAGIAGHAGHLLIAKGQDGAEESELKAGRLKVPLKDLGGVGDWLNIGNQLGYGMEGWGTANSPLSKQRMGDLWGDVSGNLNDKAAGIAFSPSETYGFWSDAYKAAHEFNEPEDKREAARPGTKTALPLTAATTSAPSGTLRQPVKGGKKPVPMPPPRSRTNAWNPPYAVPSNPYNWPGPWQEGQSPNPDMFPRIGPR